MRKPVWMSMCLTATGAVFRFHQKHRHVMRGAASILDSTRSSA
jgi:hypothetical protein